MVSPKKVSVKKPVLKKPMIKKSATQAIENPVHVRVAEPMVIRRTTLNMALDTIQLLKRYDSIMAIRRRKLMSQKKLATAYREIKRLSNSIKLKELPGMPKKPAEKKPVIAKPIVKVLKPKITVKKLELSPLEKEIEDIKNKLSKL